MGTLGGEGAGFVYNWPDLGIIGRIWGSVFYSEGSYTVRMTPPSSESHLLIVKKETPEILKPESLFSEEKKPENHFFASKSFAMISMTLGGSFCVKKGQFWTKLELYFHFLTFLDTFWTSLCIIVAERVWICV